MNTFLFLFIIQHVLLNVESEKRLFSIQLQRIKIGYGNMEFNQFDITSDNKDGSRTRITSFYIPYSKANTQIDFPFPQYSLILDTNYTRSIIIKHYYASSLDDVFRYKLRDDIEYLFTYSTFAQRDIPIRYDWILICTKIQEFSILQSYAISFNVESSTGVNTPNLLQNIYTFSVLVDDIPDIIICYLEDYYGYATPSYAFYTKCLANKNFFEMNPKEIQIKLFIAQMVNYNFKEKNFIFKFNFSRSASNQYHFSNNEYNKFFNVTTNYSILFIQNHENYTTYNGLESDHRDSTYQESLLSCKNGYLCQNRNKASFCNCLLLTYGNVQSSNKYPNGTQNLTISKNNFTINCKNYPRRNDHTNVTCSGYNKCVNGICYIYNKTPLCKCNSSFTGYYCEINCSIKCNSPLCTQINNRSICLSRDYITTTTTTTTTSTTTAATIHKKSNTYNIPNSAKIFLLIYICFLFASSTVAIVVFVLWKYLITKKSYYFNYQPEVNSTNNSKALPTIENIKSKIKTKLVVRDDPTSIFRA